MKILSVLGFLILFLNKMSGQPVLLKIIRDVSSPDSNTVIVDYDFDNKIESLTEYKKHMSSWIVVNKMIYRNDKKGNLASILVKSKSTDTTSHDILYHENGYRVNFNYWSDGNLYSWWDNKQDGWVYKYYPKQKLRIETQTKAGGSLGEATGGMFLSQDKLSYKVVQDDLGHDRNGFLQRTLYNQSVTIKSVQFYYDNKNSLANPFTCNKNSLIPKNPFRAFEISAINNTILSNYTYEYNSDNYPTQLKIKYPLNEKLYKFEYITKDEDYDWDMYRSRLLTKHAVQQFYQAKMDKKLLFDPEVKYASFIITSGSSSIHNYYNNFINVQSKSKKEFNIFNSSIYTFVIKIDGYNKFYLYPNEGVLLLKSTINDSTKMNVEYTEDDYELRKNELIQAIQLHGGKDPNLYENVINLIEKRILQRDRTDYAIKWYDQSGNLQEVKYPDPIMSTIKDLNIDILTIMLSQQAKIYTQDILMKERMQLNALFNENELLYATSQKASNLYNSQLFFPILRNFIDKK